MLQWPSGFGINLSGTPSRRNGTSETKGVAFERAASVFLDPRALSKFDEEHSQAEDRWITVGLDRAGNLLVVSHTYSDETETSARIRMISARKATRNEAKQYGSE